MPCSKCGVVPPGADRHGYCAECLEVLCEACAQEHHCTKLEHPGIADLERAYALPSGVLVVRLVALEGEVRQLRDLVVRLTQLVDELAPADPFAAAFARHRAGLDGPASS